MSLEKIEACEGLPGQESSCAPLLLKLRDIAENKRCPVVLPALQRGAVWKSRQVEELWDSLLRGFPIGSFLLTPVEGNERLGQRPVQNASEARTPNFYLLDGQQRWSAISLGFRNIWQRSAGDGHGPTRSSLWIDLEPPESGLEGRLFLFRVTSRSHPWGFQRNDPSKRLEARYRREALAAYESVKSIKLTSEDFRPGKLQLQHAWPWQAKAPIPFSMLVEVVNQDASAQKIWPSVKNALSSLPYWNADELRSYHGDWKKNVVDVLDNSHPHKDRVLDGVRRALGMAGSTRTYHIPIQTLRTNEPEAMLEGGDAPDRIETLFVRINSAGTSLEGEELRYSILKSVCPEVQDIAEKLGTRLMSPARLVTLISRLVLARIEKEENDRLNKLSSAPPKEPDVGRFRRLVDGSGSSKFKDMILCYLGISGEEQSDHELSSSPLFGRGKRIWDEARKLLVDKSWGLPNVLVTEIARSPSSVDAFFFLLAWLDRAFDVAVNFDVIADDDKRRLVGVITTLAWFTERSQDCLEALWKKLNDTKPLNELFAEGLLLACVKPNLSGQVCLIPPIPPEHLNQAIRENVLCADGFDDPVGGKVWKNWNWWDDFSCSPSTEEFLRDRFDLDDSVGLTWQKFVERLLTMRQLVLYSQRLRIGQWFPDYDPAAPDQIEDSDRPWDLDHIHPGNYGSVNSVPRIIKAWHSSIGNLRAWPLEANRDHGDIAPGLKLKSPIPKEQAAPYHLLGGDEIRAASFISETNWKQWVKSTPDGINPPRHNYLVYPENDNYAPCRAALLEAITTRWVALYREWYDTLLIASLFQPAPP